MLGYSNEELKEITPFDLIEEESRERVKKMLLELTKQKRLIQDIENWKVTKYGTKRCFSTNGAPIFNENGKLTGYRGIDKDITEKKRIETKLIESEERYRRIFELSPEAIILLDEDGLVLEVNNSTI